MSDIRATSTNTKIKISTKGFDLTGATVVLLVRLHGTTPFTALPCTVNPDKLTCYRMPLATDFPIDGTYDIQLKSTNPTGAFTYSDIYPLQVGPIIH